MLLRPQLGRQKGTMNHFAVCGRATHSEAAHLTNRFHFSKSLLGRSGRGCPLLRVFMTLPSLLASLSWKGTHVDLGAAVERGHSEGARCTSTEDRSVSSPLSSLRWIRRDEHEDFETLVCVVLHTMFFSGWLHGPLPWTKDLFL